jgi:hypothetical protein
VKPYPLQHRADLFNRKFPQLLPLVVGQFVNRDFLHGFWFVSGGNISDFYGSYQVNYLDRINSMFPDKTKVVHLFSGSLPPSPDYVRVGKDFTGKYKSDFECDAHELSSYLPFKPDLIFADPPYSIQDSDNYGCSMVNREKVLNECILVLQPNGFIVWMDTAMPLFNKSLINWAGTINYLRSTGNRYRDIVLFQKA